MNKKLFHSLIAGVLLLGCSLAATAQTIVTNQVPNELPPVPFTLTNLFSGGIGAGLQRAGEDIVYFVENTTNNGVVTVEGAVLYATKSHAVGGALDVYLPVGGTNSVFGAGIGFAYLDHNFYDATLNARLGDTFTLPFIRIPLYAYIESGGGYNLSKMEIVSQAFSGALIKIPVTTSWAFTVGGAVGEISDYSGPIIAGGASTTWTF